MLSGLTTENDVVEVAITNLVLANRILAHEGIIDSFGHVSMRHPLHPERYLTVVLAQPTKRLLRAGNDGIPLLLMMLFAQRPVRRHSHSRRTPAPKPITIQHSFIQTSVPKGQKNAS